MGDFQLLSGLSLFTLVAILALLVGYFVYFLRKRRNRIAASNALGVNDRGR